MSESQRVQPQVGLFVTCLVDLFRPSVGFAALRLLELAGCRVRVPTGQTCCGQPAYNAGDRSDAISLAKQTIQAFADDDYIVAPSGSCAGMLKHHYPSLLADDADWSGRALSFSERVYELTAFLVDVRGLEAVNTALTARATYHDSCTGLRELGVREQPRKLLATVEGLELVDMAECERCCGFGGTFSVKFPDISAAMLDAKLAHALAVTPDLVLAGDLGCLMNMAGRLSRRGSDIAVRHVAEVLAGELADPPIGRGD